MLTHWMRGLGTRVAAIAAVDAALLTAPAAAVTRVVALRESPDTTVSLSGVTVADEGLVDDDLAGAVAAVGLLPIPTSADVVACHRDDGSAELVVFDVTVALPGPVTATPRDVARWDGASWSLVFTGQAAGVPDGVRIDALTRVEGDLALSFDTTVDLGGGLVAGDEDVVTWNGASFAPLFDGSAAGLADGLDVDAMSALPGSRLLVSLDGSGSVGGVPFDDEDVLEVDAGGTGWKLVYDGSALHAGWTGADLDAVDAVVGTLPDEIFSDGFETSTTERWSAERP
jgi:hypothetical protein